MKQFSNWILAALLVVDTSGWAQSSAQSDTTLRVNSRAVLVDVIVTDNTGRPVHGLSGGAFTLKEDGKPQTIQYFEEHKVQREAQRPEIPKLPENEFSNFSPYSDPPAVNVLLLDSLNTKTENQSYAHQQALDFLKTAHSGDRMAIFTMGLGLHFIQGFNDDPTKLLAALKDPKNNEVKSSEFTKGTQETNGQQLLVAMMKEPVGDPRGPAQTVASPGAINGLITFFSETDVANSADRIWLTLQHLQGLASFLEGFPGRKNIIWFAEKVPSYFVIGSSGEMTANLQSNNPALELQIKKTLSMLAAARAALYPVHPGGVSNYSLYTSENNSGRAVTSASQLMGATTVGASAVPFSGASGNPGDDAMRNSVAHDIGGFANSMTGEALERNADQMNAEYLAEQSGGRAFANTNGLSKVVNTIAMESGDFYTLSYAPSNPNMNGNYRTIRVSVNGKYRVSYRRGYFAVNEALPGGTIAARQQIMKDIAAKNGGVVDPLLPFMDLGMPQNETILYKAKIVPLAPKKDAPDADKTHYGIDFAIDLKDLKLKTDANGVRTGKVNLSIVVYDAYGHVVANKYHIVPLTIPPAVYAAFEESGVQMRGEIAVPHKGNYWLRTGVFDWGSRKVGTMEVPLNAVKPLEVAQQSSRDIR